MSNVLSEAFSYPGLHSVEYASVCKYSPAFYAGSQSRVSKPAPMRVGAGVRLSEPDASSPRMTPWLCGGLCDALTI